ncbi:unnamed protein product [Anisakis simplex]|uniref:TPR_REGION domain-containing protein n=1 Tax=Anisakis simplex TaxID=6269 RepID=A0A0M3JHG0_ANISI|nr:unnamed protein product [Anisakis simplex]
MSEHVSYWMLLSKLHFENGNWQQASDELSKARDIQKRLINKSPSEVNNILEQRKLAARLLHYFIKSYCLSNVDYQHN